MKKKERLFILGILILAIASAGIMAFLRNQEHPTIKITIDGQEYGTYRLDKDQTIPIGETNTCEIKDGKAFMIEGDCPDQLCIHQKAIDETGGVIICLPNRVVIEGQAAASSTENGLTIDSVS